MPKKDSNRPRYTVPYISKVERSAMNILKNTGTNKEELKELLEKYAARYAEESLA
ncbi:MAG: hypothetical protein NWF14_09440 [Candidatus Bathyarchaeota archaeon]|nr:hypothetical protein [Candidatus Bathyarchaeota archaeon]